MSESLVEENNTTIEPPVWMKGLAITAGGAFITILVGVLWALLSGGLDAYVDERAEAIILAHEVTDDGSTQSEKISELTNAVNGLSTLIATSETRDAEFRGDVRGRLDALTEAVLELTRPSGP